MRAMLIQKQGTPVRDQVSIDTDWTDPKAGPGEAIIQTEASALNHLDLWVGRGVPHMELSYPRISGSDACGIVEEVGQGVDESWLGRRVILNAAVLVAQKRHPDFEPAPYQISMIGEHTTGTHCERFAAPVSQLADVGESADPIEAAAFGLTFLTAWRCLVTRAQLRHGSSVLIPGIGGGVALAGLAIAQHHGCRTIVTSRHEWKLEKSVALGADATILDNGEDWSREVRRLTGKRGVDVCLDSIGKKTHLMCIKSLARGGTYVTPGCTTGPDATTDLARIFWNQLRIIGSTMGDMGEFRAVVSLFRKGLLRPIVDRVFKAEQADEAVGRLEDGEQFGKIVIDWRTD